MSPNGRRAWRKWAKRRRRRMNAHHRALYTGAKMRKAQPVQLAMQIPKPFTPRSLVGMTQGARKRAARRAPMERFCLQCRRPLAVDEQVEPSPNKAAEFIDPECLACPDCGGETDCFYLDEVAQVNHQHYRIGQKVRPCVGCEECRGYDDGIGIIHCDGSGVLPARRA